jgi:ferritin-like metal-binding protein YciE
MESIYLWAFGDEKSIAAPAMTGSEAFFNNLLEQVFGAIGTEPKTKGNDILDKMMSAAKDSASNIDPSALRDAALIVNGNLVEHYEIATYGSLASFARHLHLQGVVDLLEATLNEEKKADAKLTQLGESLMNAQASRHQTA